MLPHFVWQDFTDVLDDLNVGRLPLRARMVRAAFRIPLPAGSARSRSAASSSSCATRWSRGTCWARKPGGGGTVRYVDSSVERLQVKVEGLNDARHVIACNGWRLPLHATGTAGEYVAGVRYRAWQPTTALHPTIGVHAPLVFDIHDTWSGRSIGGCTYHVAHPGGRNYDRVPVNANEAEARRRARFFPIGHTGGTGARAAADRQSRASADARPAAGLRP